jgi:hypothetical protein
MAKLPEKQLRWDRLAIAFVLLAGGASAAWYFLIR